LKISCISPSGTITEISRRPLLIISHNILGGTSFISGKKFTFVGNKIKDSIRSEAEVRADLEFQAEQIANREGLDLDKIEDSIKARMLVFEENPTLYEEYRKANKS
jgi:hypothetical protein